MKKELQKLIKEALESAGITDELFSLEHPSDLKMGDYSTNVAIKHQAKKNDLYRYIATNKVEGVERVEMAGPGFINFYLSKEFFKKSLEEIIEKGDNFGRGEHAKGFKVMVEHTQPNPLKIFHAGHLMNNTIGEAVARIIKANGAEIKTASYHGDKGMHIAMTVYSLYDDYKKDESKFEDGLFNDPLDDEDLKRKLSEIGHAYFIGRQMYQAGTFQKDNIIRVNKIIYTGLNDEEREFDKDIIFRLYEWGKKLSFAYFDLMYKRLGSHFDFKFLESEAAVVGNKIVLENIGKVFEEGDNGAIIFKGENYGLHTRVFLNSEKLPTYEAKEVGLAEMKKNLFDYDQSITITANEQDAFFKVTEVAIGKIFPELNGKLKHLSHGILKLPSGKMSSRMGNIITAESLIEEVKKHTKGDESVAVAAIKYMILRQGIGQDIIFDLEKSVSTEGDSGVYLQYAHARANSILEKAKTSPGSLLDARRGDEEARLIERLLYRFPEIIERAGEDYAPNYVTTYLTELASAFNNFYAHEQVLEDSPKSGYRLAIVEAFKTVMKNGLTVLGIAAPERM